MPNRTWSWAQWGLLIISVTHLAQAVAGFIAEPSFAIGSDAPTARVLGMDYNGWHAVAGLALFGPGLVLCRRNSWAVGYLLLAGMAGALPGVWALFSQQVAWIFAFPNNTTDAAIHLATGTVMIVLALIQIRRDGGSANTFADLRERIRA